MLPQSLDRKRARIAYRVVTIHTLTVGFRILHAMSSRKLSLRANDSFTYKSWHGMAWHGMAWHGMT